jgi:predicted transcriptional regulator
MRKREEKIPEVLVSAIEALGNKTGRQVLYFLDMDGESYFKEISSYLGKRGLKKQLRALSIAGLVKMTLSRVGDEFRRKYSITIFASDLIRNILVTVDPLACKKIKSMLETEYNVVPVEQARELVLDYMKEHPDAWGSEISDDLQLDLDLTFKVLRGLKEEGRIKHD